MSWQVFQDDGLPVNQPEQRDMFFFAARGTKNIPLVGALVGRLVNKVTLSRFANHASGVAVLAKGWPLSAHRALLARLAKRPEGRVGQAPRRRWPGTAVATAMPVSGRLGVTPVQHAERYLIYQSTH